jgi:hypothetical protein
MKNTFRKTTIITRKIFSFAFLALAVFMVSCEIPTDPADILELRLDTNIFTHKGFISITDLADQNNLAGTALKAKVTLKNSNTDILVTEGGFIKDTYDINDGIAAFAVNPKYRGFTEPINFTLEIFGEDYLTKILDITITPADSITEIRETFLNIKKVPSGVAVAQETAPLSGGSNEEAITVTTDTSSTNTSAEIVVPANNVFKDVNGSVISSSDLIAQVVYFDGNDEEANRSSINSNVESIVDENGNILKDVIIKPVATVDIKMSLGNKEVKKFEKEITISMDVSADFTSPITGEKVKAGDEFNIYSTSDNGNWAFESKGTVIIRGGKLVVDIQTDHLSTYTLGTVESLCGNSGFLFISLGNNASKFSASYSAVFRNANGLIISPTNAVKKSRSGVIGLEINNPPTESTTLTLTGSTGLSVTTALTDWCSDNVTVSEATLAGLILAGVTVDLNVSAKCSSQSSIIPNQVRMKIEYITGSNNFTDVGLIKEGKISVPGITLNKRYNLRIFYDGKSGDGTYTFNSTEIDILNYELPGDVCKELGLN